MSEGESLLSAERHFEIARSIEALYTVAYAEVPAANSIEPGSATPMVFAEKRRRARDFVAGDTFTSLTVLAGVLNPIEWEIVEITSKEGFLSARRGRFQITSKGLQGISATIVLNVYENESLVSADLFVLIDEIMLSGGLQHSFMRAIEAKIDSLIDIARQRFPVLRDTVVVPE